jgi:hypothetical protein
MMQRLFRDLGDRVPHRDLDGADADRALAVAAGFLVLHHDGEDFFRRKIVAAVVDERFRRGFEDARNKACAHLRAAGVAAGRIERESRNWPAVADHVGDHRNDRRRHLGKINAGISERRIERDGSFTDVGNTHEIVPVNTLKRNYPTMSSRRLRVNRSTGVRGFRIAPSARPG